MKFNVGYKDITFDPLVIRYYCPDCGFERWADKIIAGLKCPCGYIAEHEEWEG